MIIRSPFFNGLSKNDHQLSFPGYRPSFSAFIPFYELWYYFLFNSFRNITFSWGYRFLMSALFKSIAGQKENLFPSCSINAPSKNLTPNSAFQRTRSASASGSWTLCRSTILPRSLNAGVRRHKKGPL